MTIAVADLVGLEYEACGRCYGLVRTVLARSGIALPAEVADLMASRSEYGRTIAAGEPPRAGDVVVMLGIDPDYELHLGVMVGVDRFLHATREGSRVDRLSVWSDAGQVLRIVRPIDHGEGAA